MYIQAHGSIMREITFKMERPGLVKEGDSVHVSEKKTALNYSYIIEPAVAMSGCFKVNERIEDRDGIVKEIKHTERGYYVIVEFVKQMNIFFKTLLHTCMQNRWRKNI